MTDKLFVAHVKHFQFQYTIMPQKCAGGRRGRGRLAVSVSPRIKARLTKSSLWVLDSISRLDLSCDKLIPVIFMRKTDLRAVDSISRLDLSCDKLIALISMCKTDLRALGFDLTSR